MLILDIFEEVTDRNWIAVDYYFGSVRAICQSLKIVFEQYASGIMEVEFDKILP